MSGAARARALLLALLVAGFVDALALGAGLGPAFGDTGTTTTAGQSALGGYTLSATGAGVSVYYEQPNLPVPATPSLEADIGYSQATFDAGPIGQSLASVLWPGSVVANGASQLNLLLDGYLEPYFGSDPPQLPDAGPWPAQATTSYPQGPEAQSNDNGPVSMDASSTSAASTADAALGAVGGSSAVPAGMLSAQTTGSSVQSTVDGAGQAVAQATSSVHGVSVAGGLITVGEVTSTATASSDGNQAVVNGSSTVSQVAVAGQAVTVDASGVHVPGGSTSTVPVLGSLTPSVAQVLSTAGITMTVTNPTDTVNGASGERQLDGLQIVVDLSTLDKGLATLATMLPAQMTSALDQLPLPLPDAQTLTIDLGWVNVNSAASPPYDADVGGGADDGSPLPSSTAGPTDLGAGPGSPGTAGSVATAGTSGTPGTGGTGGPAARGTGVPGSTPVLATAPVGLFKGIGAGLVVLGLVLAGLLALALLRADAAVGASNVVACAGETPAAGLGGER